MNRRIAKMLFVMICLALVMSSIVMASNSRFADQYDYPVLFEEVFERNVPQLLFEEVFERDAPQLLFENHIRQTIGPLAGQCIAVERTYDIAQFYNNSCAADNTISANDATISATDATSIYTVLVTTPGCGEVCRWQ